MAGNLTLWGRANSVNVQKAVWALEELGLDYERKDVGGSFGGLDTPEYGKLNPNRLVPTLQDSELTVWESHAIVRYLSARYGLGTLWSENPEDRALADQWMDWTATTFQPAWITLFTLIVRVPRSRHDAAAIDTARRQTVATMEMLDAALSGKQFLGGDRVSYADIVAGAALYRWFTLEIARPDLRNVAAWYERLKARPAYEKGVCVSYEALRAPDE